MLFQLVMRFLIVLRHVGIQYILHSRKLLKRILHLLELARLHPMAILLGAFLGIPSPICLGGLHIHLIAVLPGQLDVPLHLPKFDIGVVDDDQR